MSHESEKNQNMEINSEKELFEAMDTMAQAKIENIKYLYGKKPELEKHLADAIQRIQNEHADFKMKEARKILDVGMFGIKTNTPQDVYEIFTNRIENLCGELYNAAERLNKNHDQLEYGPQSGVEEVRTSTHKKAKKAA